MKAFLLVLATIYFLWRAVWHLLRGEYTEAYLAVIAAILLASHTSSTP